VQPPTQLSGNFTLTGDLAQTGDYTLTGAASVSGDLTIADKIVHDGDTNTAIRFPAADTVAVETAGSERVRVDSSGNVGIGTSSPAVPLHVFTTNSEPARFVRDLATDTGLSIQSDNSGPILDTVGVHNLRLFTDGTERMRIDASGSLLVGTTTGSFAATGTVLFENGQSNYVAAGGTVQFINRLTDDGDLVQFYQGNTLEGSISVSGTAVSYNGGHLARWSQTADNTRIDILRGTVLTNLDQMAVWIDPETGEPQDNEQLNCTAISSVEGDPNVAGVFVNWDNDDDVFANDMNIAMTGDFIIRIGAGVTVQRGDLLMSAGDGTAKPQGDDIVRSKTIAKVTSTHVTCTYEDGSYCVPCVLMAC
jgi:hypothetical protein